MPTKPPYPAVEPKLALNLDKMTRKVYCRYCKYEIITNLAAPLCGDCNNILISPVN